MSSNNFASALCDFLDSSPTSFHAADVSVRILTDAGFTLLHEDDAWPTTPGRYVVQRDGAFIAWSQPQLASVPTVRLVGAHTDSPTLKVKPSVTSRSRDDYQQVDIETYGGLIPAAWLNRELGLAGVIVTKDGQRHLTSTDGPVMIIPQLAIHLDRTQRDKLTISNQQHLHPICALPGASCDIVGALATGADIDRDDIGGMEIYAYDTHRATLFGPNDQMLASSRQDNLLSTFSALQAMRDLPTPDDNIAMIACFDHEEVGSSTRSGAAGSFLEDTLRRIIPADVFHRSMAQSACLSVDVAHALNPNYADKHDPATFPVMGGGPVLKFNADQRYPTDATGQALWANAVEATGVTSQSFVSHNDIPSGSTIASMIATRLGLVTLDAGVAIWSMHSLREVSSPADSADMTHIMRSFMTCQGH